MDDMKAKELHDLLYSLVGMFHQKFLCRFRKEYKSPPWMKKNHAKIINLLYRNERLTATEIGKRLDIEKGSLTTLIDQLEERGFVVRESDPADRRRFLIALSDAGREEMNRAMDFYTSKLNDFFQGIDPQELEQFMQSLRYAVTFLNKM